MCMTMKPTNMALTLPLSLLLLASSVAEGRNLLKIETANRKDGVVSKRFSAAETVEADAEAREERLRRLDAMEARLEAAVDMYEKKAEAPKDSHELAPMRITKRAKMAILAASVSATSMLEMFPGGWSGTNLPPPGERVPPFNQVWYDPRFEYGRNWVLSIITCILCMIVAWWLFAECSGAKKLKEQKDEGEDIMGRSEKDLEHDTYGFAMVSLIRDMQMTELIQTPGNPTSNPALRMTRMGMAIALLCFTFGLQVFVTLQVKQFVTSKWVYGIRKDYDAYQLHMYGEDPEAFTIGAPHPIFPVKASRRGVPGYFMPGNFATLDEGLKESICNIPFSQAPFFMCVLLIWSMTCIVEVRMSISMFRSLVLQTKTISSMKDALVDLDPELDDDDPGNRWVVDGLTICVKLAITFLVVIPRLLLVCFLLWLGCRFLAATNDMGEMVLNAVALEFILLIKDLLYRVVVPDRNKREIEKIAVRPSSNIEFASYWAYLGTFTWGFVAIAWIFYYVFLIQMVLPRYNWDVRPLCLPWLQEKYGPHA
eukprot:TRINITY_DN74669_c0_g1_i1.p2 TRINITY_DN74669_c0_g1~~TRINITY_DN74669_c0_g1_i1.p2  ORF type:complete len:539 (-),score=153.30 TRINITY_DN74669_c0_g1_i1:178-1794(-)